MRAVAIASVVKPGERRSVVEGEMIGKREFVHRTSAVGAPHHGLLWVNIVPNAKALTEIKSLTTY